MSTLKPTGGMVLLLDSYRNNVKAVLFFYFYWQWKNEYCQLARQPVKASDNEIQTFVAHTKHYRRWNEEQSKNIARLLCNKKVWINGINCMGKWKSEFYWYETNFE